MKVKLSLLLLLLPFVLSAQHKNELNADFKISDSLTYPIEIRIYQSVGITNYDSLFRMYKKGSDEWIAELYEHWSKIEGVAKLETKKTILTSKSEMEYVYLSLFRSYIFELPSQSDIRWKLQERGEIQYLDKLKRGILTQELDILFKQSMALDGTNYSFIVQEPNKKNSFNFGDPSWCLERYPEIDEPKFVNEILEIIRDEFGIWKR